MEAVEALNGGRASFYAPPVGQQPLGITPSATALPKACDLPAYFGRGEEDPAEDEGEGFADFALAGGDDPTYRLVPDFTKVFDYKGVEKAAGGAGAAAAASPELDTFWKPIDPGAQTYTAFFTKPKVGPAGPRGGDWSVDSLRGSGAEEGGYAAHVQKVESAKRDRLQGATLTQPAGADKLIDMGLAPVAAPASQTKEREALLARIDGLMARIDALERSKRGGSQNELLLFVGTGLFLLASFNLAAKC
jgi:hypothetical protein